MTAELARPMAELGLEAAATLAAVWYATNARSGATRKAYRSDWAHFMNWCAQHGASTALPIAGELVAVYVAELAEKGKALSTIHRRVAAISEAHAMAGLVSPRLAPALREVMKGIRRRYATEGKRQVGKAALELADLRRVSAACPDWLIGLRDRAILVAGWAGGFRRGELAALELADFELREGKGYVVTVRRSKTDQMGAGQKKILPYGSDPLTCPVRTVMMWLSAASIVGGRVFRSVDQHSRIGEGLTGQAVAKIIKARVAAVGLDPRTFSGHSLRAGFCTTAAKAGKNARAIMAQTGHRSAEMVLRYVRDANLFEDNAAMGIGL